MLVLSRRPGEAILIGDDIEIRVLAGSRDSISLGITAPKEMREEIANGKKEAVHEGVVPGHRRGVL